MSKHIAKSPIIPYYGGKVKQAARIAALFPEHTTYVEPYGGAGSVLFAKPPSPIEIFNDLHNGIYVLYKTLRDPVQYERLRVALELTPYSRAEFEACARTWEEEGLDDVERARRFFVVARLAWSGIIETKNPSMKMSYTHPSRGMPLAVSSYLSGIDRMETAHLRLRRVQIERRPALELIDRCDGPETLFYLDPPYIPGTCDPAYRYAMSVEDHQTLRDRLLALKGKAVLSIYDHPIYQDLLQHGWTRIEIGTIAQAPQTFSARTRKLIEQVRGALTKPKRVETLYLNFSPVPSGKAVAQGEAPSTSGEADDVVVDPA